MALPMKALFVAGAHTEIGKTHVACALIRAARAKGLSVEALKPVVSGFDAGDWAESDPGRLLAALGEPLTPVSLDRISPWRFAAPLAPPLAAELEARPLPFGPVVELCRRRLAQSTAALVIVEGVGGLMSPIAEGATCLDLIQALAIPTVLVGGGYLGAISHTLTACEVLTSRGLAPVAVVASQADAATVRLTAEHLQGVRVIAAEASWAEALI